MKFNVGIIGGGLTGLSLAIDMCKRGYSVILFEKGTYPKHKVCGEYISMESHRYLFEICPPLQRFQLPYITEFKITSGKTKSFKTPLNLGGFGISRYILEKELYDYAKKIGVTVMCKAKVNQAYRLENLFHISTTNKIYTSDILCNTSGRKSNLRTDAQQHSRHNYIGVKYHVKMPRKKSLIEIHNFPGGYCGISAIEDDKSCLCYIVNSDKLKDSRSSITDMEKNFLYQNKSLKRIFSEAQFLFEKPITISNINFRIKERQKDDIFYLGDAAGSIAPITGNGMSIGLRSASVLTDLLDSFFQEKVTYKELTAIYENFWTSNFSLRIKLSRTLQKLSEYPFLSNRTIDLFNIAPFIARSVIKQTHGKPF